MNAPQAPQLPHGIPSILDRRRPYNHHTNVSETWKRFGWVPPREQKGDRNENQSQ